MTHLGLFEGIGGFSLAAQWMGWETKAWCEINQFGQQVLKHYWPEAEGFTDITKSDFTKYANRIDVLTGGFPCQPYSQAGKRLGKEDDRHLWPQMLRAIREVSPRFVVGENVRGLTNWNGGLVFDEVQSDLEAEGYEVLPFLLPACAVNAPHRRDRIWFIAYSESTNAVRNGRRKYCEWEGNQEVGLRSGGEFSGNGSNGLTTNHYSKGQHRCNSEHEINASEGREYAQCNVEQMGEYVTNASNQGLQRRKINGGIGSSRTGHIEQLTGLLQPNWQEFPTQPPICSRNDGLSSALARSPFLEWEQGLGKLTPAKHRNESIKAYGNAVVPQVVFEIFKAIQQFDNKTPVNP